MSPRRRTRTSTSGRGKHKCIVIGAGLAGLAAAYRLKQNKKENWDVVVYEAAPRIGGRVMSHRFRKPAGYRHLVCELGGEWIGTDHCAMMRLVRDLGLPLIDHQYSLSFARSNKKIGRFYEPGEWTFSSELKQKFDQFACEFKSLTPAGRHALDRLDWWNKLKSLGFTIRDLHERDLMDSTDSGESIRHTSAYSAAAEYVEGNASDEMDYKIDGGNSRLIDVLEARIGRSFVRTKMPVHSITHDNGKVFVGFDNGERDSADACICAIPSSCLGKITWDPAPDKHLAAAEQLQYARITKTAILYENPFWDKPPQGGFSLFTNLASDFCFESTHLQTGRGGILCSYSIGDKADDIASEPDDMKVARWITKDVHEAIRRKTRLPHPLAVARQPWQNEEWIGGAYAFYRPGQWFKIRPALAKPFLRVQFAGEHIADEQGFMEGAVNTGEAAADNL
jgi:monoamine oxidase